MYRKRKWDQDDHSEAAPATKITKVEADPTKAVSKYIHILGVSNKLTYS